MLNRNGDLLIKKFNEYLLPTIASTMSLLLAAFVDGIIVSRMLGDNEFSAVNISEPVVLFMQALFFMFGLGGMICISIAVAILTLGFGLIFVWVGSMVWAYMDVEKYNQALLSGQMPPQDF